MKKVIVFTISIILLLCGCSKEEVIKSEKNDCILVNVLHNGVPVQDATVFTEPETVIGHTDVTGTYKIDIMQHQQYSVFAYDPELGGGEKSIIVREGTNAVDLDLVSIYRPMAIPQVELISPVLPAEFKAGDPINIKVKMFDQNEALQELKCKVTSSLDGDVAEGRANSEGFYEVELSGLSSGIHEMVITVRNSKVHNSIKFILHYGSPIASRMLKAKSYRGRVELEWEQSSDPAFESYELYAASDANGVLGAKKIASISSPNITSYLDRMPLMYPEIYYFVKVRNSAGLESTSNALKVDQPFNGYLDIYPSEAFLHSDGQSLFIFDKSDLKLYKVNIDSSIIEAEQALPAGIVDCDMPEENHDAIYAVSADGIVYAYSTNDLSMHSEVSYDMQVHSMMCISGDKVLLTSSSNYNWKNSLKVVEVNQHRVIYSGGDRGQIIVKKIPGKRAAISLTTNLIPCDMHYYEWDENGVITTIKEDSQHGDYPLNGAIFSISDKGRYAITDELGAIYVADKSMKYKGSMLDYYTDYNNTIGCYYVHEDNDKIYGGKQRKNHLAIYSLSSNQQLKEVELRGLPRMIFQAGDDMLVVSQTQSYPAKMILEFIEQ